MDIEILPENATLRLWQKDENDMFDYYFEFEPDGDFNTVDMTVCEQYYIEKLIGTYYVEMDDYSDISKFSVPVSESTRRKIVEYFENRNIKMLFD